MYNFFQKLIIPGFILLSFMSCSVTEKLTNDIRLETIRGNRYWKEYSNITLATYGNSILRIFFDNLYKELSPRLAAYGINAIKVYLGNDSLEVTNNIEKLVTRQGQDAILMMLPQSNGSLIEYIDEIIAINIRSVKLDQRMVFEIYEKEDYFNWAVWQSELDMDINLTQNGIYNKIAEKLILDMVSNKIIQEPYTIE